MGRLFASLTDGGPGGYDAWEAADRRKRARQAERRRRLGLEPAPYVESGLADDER